MATTYRLKIVYQPEPIPEASELEWLMPDVTEEEIVEVTAGSVEDAVRMAMFSASVSARGRLVRYFDEAGAEVFGSLATRPDPGSDLLWTLQTGDRVSTLTGDEAEVVAPTEDGEWIRVRYVVSPRDSLIGSEDLLSIDEVAELL